MRFTYLATLSMTLLSLNVQALTCVGRSRLPTEYDQQLEVRQRYLEMSQISPEVFSSQDVYTKVQRCSSQQFSGYVVEQQYVSEGVVKYSHFTINTNEEDIVRSVSALQMRKF
jgi:hypothetical protein